MPSKVISPKSRGANIDNLQPNQRMWCEYLLADPMMNGTEAARKVGYKNPSTVAAKLFRHPKICAYLGKRIQERIDRTEVTQDRVLQELAYIAFADTVDLVDEDGNIRNLRDIPEAGRRAMAGLEIRTRTNDDGSMETKVTPKWHNKVSALELLARHLGMLNDKLSIKTTPTDGLVQSLLERLEEERKTVDADFIERIASE